MAGGSEESLRRTCSVKRRGVLRRGDSIQKTRISSPASMLFSSLIKIMIGGIPLAAPPAIPHALVMSDEQQLWKGSPSQWLNIGKHIAALIIAAAIIVAGIFFPPAFIALVFPILWAVWNSLVVRCKVFELTTQRLRFSEGVINRHIDEIELYRIKDSLMTRAWWMRLTGLATIELQTSDRSTPQLTIPAIPRGEEIREMLRKQVELVREKKRVREMDFDDAGSDIEMI
jgi:membrane protein YdbS with pleckstrin-like domain